MTDEQIKETQEFQKEESLTILDAKRKKLLDEIDALMEKMGDDWGPVFQEELQRRLESVIHNFNEEVKTLFSISFNKWSEIDNHLRDLLDSNMQLSTSLPVIKDNKKSSTPEFIKNVEFGPLRSK